LAVLLGAPRRAADGLSADYPLAFEDAGAARNLGGFVALVVLPTLALILAALRAYVCPEGMGARPKQESQEEHGPADLTRQEALFNEAAAASVAPPGVEPGQASLPDVSRSVWWQGYTPHLTPGAAGTPYATSALPPSPGDSLPLASTLWSGHAAPPAAWGPGQP
jgi:hypothetical protein